MSSWDVALVAVVSVLGTVVAYLCHPAHKAFVLMLPVPFTLAVMRLAQARVGLAPALAAGWLVYLPGLWLLRGRFLPRRPAPPSPGPIPPLTAGQLNQGGAPHDRRAVASSQTQTDPRGRHRRGTGRELRPQRQRPDWA